MESNTISRPSLAEETARRFGILVLLDRIISEPGGYHAGLLDGDDAFLEPLFDEMLRADLATVGGDDHFHATARGRAAYRLMLHQQQSYLAHFDVFAAVDLAEGVFADPARDYLDDPRWADLRVAVAEYKGIDPYRMVFLSMLAGGHFFENPGWKFDLVLGSSFFNEVEEIVRSQIAVGELGYEDEDGTRVPGEAVLEDVILQGARVNRERAARELSRQPTLFGDGEADGADGPRDPGGAEDADEAQDSGAGLPPGDDDAPYDPWGPLQAYEHSAIFAEPLWHADYW